MTVPRDYGESVMVRLDRKVHERLCCAKIIPREPLSDCVNRIIDENQKFKAVNLPH